MNTSIRSVYNVSKVVAELSCCTVYMEHAVSKEIKEKYTQRWLKGNGV